MITKTEWILLHGFLGRPSDWLPLSEALKSSLKGDHEFIAVDYMKNPKLDSSHDFKKWSANFSEFLNEKTSKHHKTFPDVPLKINLAGYSMGGRLILNYLYFEKNNLPDELSDIHILASQWGLQSAEEKRKRFSFDEMWSQKFLKDKWSQVIEDWNGLDIFNHSRTETVRSENDYSRSLLSNCLLRWSQAEQCWFPPADIRRDLIQTKQLSSLRWYVGANDAKYLKIYSDNKKTDSDFEFSEIQKSGHRLILDNPSDLALSISTHKI